MKKSKTIENHPAQCYGCFMCSHICPQNAIKMKLDAKGFFYPYVDDKACIKCGRCVSVCPIGKEKSFMNERVNKCYAIKNNNDEIRLQSSSGGIYTAFTDHVIQGGGIV